MIGKWIASSFLVTLYNLNYGQITDKVSFEDINVAIDSDYVAIEVAIGKLNVTKSTISKVKNLLANFGFDSVFGRSDIASITNDSFTAAGNLITKLKDAGLIEPVSGYGKGKYKFTKPQE